MDAKLVVVSGTTKASEVTLRLPAVIGRGRDSTVMLPHPLVSRRHCEVFESNGYLVVRDMGSLNGTFVNNKRITEAVLPPGGLLTLGSITFQAAYELSPAVAQPPGNSPPAAPQPVEAASQAAGTESPGVQDFGDFDLVERPEGTTSASVRKKPPKRGSRGGPPQPASPAPPAPSKSEDEDLADFLSDIE